MLVVQLFKGVVGFLKAEVGLSFVFLQDLAHSPVAQVLVSRESSSSLPVASLSKQVHLSLAPLVIDHVVFYVTAPIVNIIVEVRDARAVGALVGWLSTALPDAPRDPLQIIVHFPLAEDGVRVSWVFIYHRLNNGSVFALLLTINLAFADGASVLPLEPL